MATLKERLSEEMKSALKGGAKDRLAFARNLHAAVRKKEIDDRVDLDDSGVAKIVQTLAKQRQDSIEQFEKGGRQDLVDKEKAELAFLQSYLPKQISDAELADLVSWAVTEAKAATMKDLGNVMKLLVPKTQGCADGKKVHQLVREKLGAS